MATEQDVKKTITPDFVDHMPHPDQVPGAPNYYMQAPRPAFPDLEIVIHDQISEGDKVVTRKSYLGTHRGDFLGLPATGRAVEHWAVVDMAGLLAQLTATEP